MRNLDLIEMEGLSGGWNWGCALSVAGTVASFAGLAVAGPITGGASWVALGSAAAGYIIGSASIGYSC